MGVEASTGAVSASGVVIGAVVADNRSVKADAACDQKSQRYEHCIGRTQAQRLRQSGTGKSVEKNQHQWQHQCVQHSGGDREADQVEAGRDQSAADREQQRHRTACQQGMPHELLNLAPVLHVAADNQDRAVGQKPGQKAAEGRARPLRITLVSVRRSSGAAAVVQPEIFPAIFRPSGATRR
jgi:hypothetical protein